MRIQNTDETVPLKVTCGSHGVDEMLQGGAQLPLLLLLQAKVQGVEDDHPQLCHSLQHHSFLMNKDTIYNSSTVCNTIVFLLSKTTTL
jgi:hypothetical protein